MNSYLAIVLAALIPMVLGYIWYHPKVLGTAWMNSLGITEEKLKEGNMGMIMGLAFALALFLAWRMNAYASHTEPGMSQFVHGFFHGAYSMGLPAAVVLVSNGLFQRNTATNLIINALYWILALGLMGSFLYSVAAPEAAPVG
ncbi:MAG: DUF1761 domain-containing protein [Saprospiraceae bacterium]|nr:DUF1761 domain-containing protein [Saprospiraceae bacterium]MCB9342926.1 DUF1761 domain-containing protein [Lewinellaceae bacterium]